VVQVKRFAEFFTVPIRNPNTRQALLPRFQPISDLVRQAGLQLLEDIEPITVAAYIERHLGWPATKKQHMTAIRMLFSWFTEKGVLDMNPGREVKTEKFLRTEGKTPAFAEGDVQRLLDAIETFTHTGLRDRALLDTLAYTLPDRRRREPQSRRLLPQRETVFAPL
jgi:site-specific recombinase XerD